MILKSVVISSVEVRDNDTALGGAIAATHCGCVISLSDGREYKVPPGMIAGAIYETAAEEVLAPVYHLWISAEGSVRGITSGDSAERVLKGWEAVEVSL